MDNNTLYTILQRYFKALSYTGYVQLQDLQYLIVLVYIKDIQGQIDKNITDIAIRTIKSKCSFCNSSFDIQDQEYQPVVDNGYSIDFFNINLSSDKVKLNIGQGSNVKYVTIPSATQSLAGVLSSDDKTVIDKVGDAIKESILINGLSTQQNTDSVSIRYSQMNPDGSFEDNSINLPLATQSKAGVMSSADKRSLESLKTSTIGYLGIDYSDEQVGISIAHDQSSTAIGEVINSATTTTAGVMSASDKARLNNLFNTALVESISFALNNNKRYLTYKLSNKTTPNSAQLPQFGESLRVVADSTLTGNENCTIELYGCTASENPNTPPEPISSINLPVVNEFNNGVMSPAMFLELRGASNSISSMQEEITLLNNTKITTFDIGYRQDTVDIALLSSEGNPIEANIEAASVNNAGVMTAGDKSIVNNASTLLSNSPLVDKLQFAVANNKRWLQYKNNGNSVFTGISMPVFGEKVQVIADYEATGKTDCTINLLALDDSIISSSSIPVVNDRHDGVMSTTLYRDLYETKALAKQLYNTAINTYDVGYNSDSVDVTLLTNGSNPIEANIEAATITTAGVMSAQDKQQLTNVVSEMPTISDNIDAIAGALPKVTDTFEGAYDNKGLLYVVRKNKLIAILKDWQVIYVPEGGIALVDAIAPSSFSIGDKVYNVPAGITYVELGLTAPITGNDMYNKVLYQNAGIRGFGLYLDGSKNTSLGNTFTEAADLEWLDISGMDTKAVTYGFAMCRFNPKLRKIYGKWQLPAAERADRAFMSCPALEEVDVSEAGMGKCKEMVYMFSSCSSLISLDVSSWDTSACTDMGHMFDNCSTLTSLDVSAWNTAACTTMSSMFNGCRSLTTLDVSNWNTGACTNMDSMFNGCSSLASLDVSRWNTAACTLMYNMFNGCSSLTSLDVSRWDTSAVTNFLSMFRDCSKLQALDCSNWDVSTANNIESFFRSCKALKELKTNGFANSICTSVYCMFIGCEVLQAIDISGLDPTNVTDAYGAFSACYALTTLRWPMMGKVKADTTNNKTIALGQSPLDRASLDSIFSYDRTANGLTNPLTVQLSATSKALLSAEDIAAITAKGYTIV